MFSLRRLGTEKRMLILTFAGLTSIPLGAQTNSPALLNHQKTVLGAVSHDDSIIQTWTSETASGCRLAYASLNTEGMYLDGMHLPGSYVTDMGKGHFSPNGQRFAYLVYMKDGSGFVVLDGIQQPTFDQVEPTSLIFSSDSNHFAYYAVKDHKFLAILDGKPGPEFNAIYSLIFSPDGKRMGYQADKGGMQGNVMVVDGVTGEGYLGFGAPFIFSPDSQHFAYAAADDHSRCYVIEDDKQGPAFEACDSPIFSPDSKHIAYAAKKDSHWGMVLDGNMTGEFDAFRDNSVKFSPDSTRLAYATRDGAHWHVIVDGMPGFDFDDVSSPIFSADSKHIAYRAKKGKQWQIVVDDKPGPIFDQVGDPILSSDGRHVMYTAKMENRSIVVTDDKSGAEFDAVGNLIMNHDGTHIAYRDDTQRWSKVVIDGLSSTQLDGVKNLTFSSNDKHVVYVAYNNGRTQIMLDGVPWQSFDDIGTITPEFSADGKPVAFAARVGPNWQVYIGGIPGPAFERVYCGPVLCSDGRIEYIALEPNGADHVLVRVDVRNVSAAKP
jgi:hypothetical protein